jgi:hypothetical protein
MLIEHRDRWLISRSLVGHDLNGELETASAPVRRLLDRMSALPLEARQAAWDGFLCNFDDPAALVMALAEVDPMGPAPEATPAAFATVADVRRALTGTRWVWPGWIPAGRVFGIAAFEGVGKTRTAADLHRRVHHGLEWPDGHPATLPPGRPALWICADGHHDELCGLLPAFGLPDESVVFPAPPDEPYEGTDLDNPELTDPGGILERAIAAVNPWCVFIDTLTNATARDLCDQRTMKGLKAPLVRLAQTTGVNIGLLLHLSREGQALGRRIRGITRTLMHLECPDPENQPDRLKLWMEKSYDKKPQALGVTLEGDKNAYDDNPPRKPEPNLGGRPPEKREKAREFIAGALEEVNDQIARDLCARWVKAGEKKNAFWKARDAMVEDGELVCDGKPLIMHLIRDDSEDDDDDAPEQDT